MHKTAPHINHVLVVDDEAVIRRGIEKALEGRGIRATLASSGEEALDILKTDWFDVALVDVRLPRMDGLHLLKQIRAKHPDLKVVMITGYPTIDSAVECIKMGALDYLVKPFRLEDLEGVLRKAQRPVDSPPIPGTNHELTKRHVLENMIIGKSPAIQAVFDRILKLAPTDSTVLITGESGTGKELVAKGIHSLSKRKDHEFVAVDCSSLVETLLESELFGHVKGSFTGAIQTKHGLFELANHGTFFFDEISNLTPNIQAKLLRVIQEREFMKVGDQRKIKLDIRILAASNQDLQKAIRRGKFREDLYYRLSVVPLRLPPLRKRREDIPLLVDHFLQRFSRKIKRAVPDISQEALIILKEYAWPGNVRELEHTIERILILEDTDHIQARDLPSFITQRQGEFQMLSEDPLSLQELEKRYIRFVLRRVKGKKILAAQILGINRKTLAMKIKKYGLQ
jgi:DNA-binding NtrC family response regulator